MLSSPTLRTVEIIESLFEKALGLSVQAMKMERSGAELTNRTYVFWDLYNLVNKSFTPVCEFLGEKIMDISSTPGGPTRKAEGGSVPL